MTTIAFIDFVEIIIFLSVGFVSVFYERLIFPLITVVVLLAINTWFVPGIDFNHILNFSEQNFTLTISALILYVVIGIGWAYFKWSFIFVEKVNRAALQINREIVLRETVDSDYLARHVLHIADRIRALTGVWVEISPTNEIQILASEHKNKITTWMMYWPFSVPVTFFSDGIIRFYKFVLDHVSNAFQHAANRRLSVVNDQIKQKGNSVPNGNGYKPVP